METLTPALQKMYVCIDDYDNIVVEIRSVEIELVQLISSTESHIILNSRNVLGLEILTHEMFRVYKFLDSKCLSGMT